MHAAAARLYNNSALPEYEDPISSASPVPTMIAMGVASPKAQGQATMRTATAFTRASGICVAFFVVS